MAGFHPGKGQMAPPGTYAHGGRTLGGPAAWVGSPAVLIFFGGKYMQPLSAGVGLGQPNRKHDGALVQGALKLIKDAKGKPFLAGAIDGAVGGGTNAAIASFQSERMKAAPEAPANLGRVLPGSSTERALVDALPADARLAAIPDQKVVHRAGTLAVKMLANRKLAQETRFEAGFRQALRTLNDAVYDAWGLALTVAPQGGFRTFQEQYELPPSVTGAGPGESNHNYGYGCDFGFLNFAFLTDLGTWQEENVWLSVQLDKLGLAQPFWDVRNGFFGPLKLFPSKLPGDIVHVQAYDDNHVSMTKSLADLLTRCSPNNCLWSFQGHYNASLIFSDTAKWPVGTAKQIWAGSAPVAAASLAAALEDARTLRNAQPSGKLPDAALETAYARFAGVNRPAAKAWTAGEITAAQIKIMQGYLQEDLQAAQTNYLKWRPVSY
jgi:hypothetical protein